jgi:hypothetical protein
MGIQVNAQLEDSEYIKGVQRFQTNYIKKITFFIQFKCVCFKKCRISEVLLERFFSFGSLLLPDWLYYLTPLGREHAKLITQMHDFTTKVCNSSFPFSVNQTMD